jgi:hypothetical protein
MGEADFQTRTRSEVAPEKDEAKKLRAERDKV